MGFVILDDESQERFLTAAMCAELLGVTKDGWRSMVAAGRRPKPAGYLDARTPLWLEADILQLVAKRGGV